MLEMFKAENIFPGKPEIKTTDARPYGSTLKNSYGI